MCVKERERGRREISFGVLSGYSVSVATVSCLSRCLTSFIRYPVFEFGREMRFSVELVPSQDVFHLSSGTSSGALL